MEARGRKGPASALFGFGGQCLGLSHPTIGPRRKPDFFADMVRGVVIEFGQLPVMENAEVVELLLDRAGHAGELLEIVGAAARPRKTLEAGGLRRRRNFLAGRLCGGTDVDSGLALCARNAVNGGASDQIAIQLDGAAGVVIAWHHIGDALGIGVGIDDRGDGNV